VASTTHADERALAKRSSGDCLFCGGGRRKSADSGVHSCIDSNVAHGSVSAGIAGCCARATGHATAAPPSVTMNSRRWVMQRRGRYHPLRARSAATERAIRLSSEALRKCGHHCSAKSCHKRAFGTSARAEPMLQGLRTTDKSLWRFESPTPAVSMIKEGADCGFEQTHHTSNGRRGDSRSVARACSAVWARRSCYVVLRKRRPSYPL
jgi:hypothetical protein